MLQSWSVKTRALKLPMLLEEEELNEAEQKNYEVAKEKILGKKCPSSLS